MACWKSYKLSRIILHGLVKPELSLENSNYISFFFYFSAQNCLLYECLLKIDFLIDLVNFGEIFRRYFHLAKQDKRYKNIKQFHKILFILIVGMS